MESDKGHFHLEWTTIESNPMGCDGKVRAVFAVWSDIGSEQYFSCCVLLYVRFSMVEQTKALTARSRFMIPKCSCHALRTSSQSFVWCGILVFQRSWHRRRMSWRNSGHSITLMDCNIVVRKCSVRCWNLRTWLSTMINLTKYSCIAVREKSGMEGVFFSDDGRKSCGWESPWLGWGAGGSPLSLYPRWIASQGVLNVYPLLKAFWIGLSKIWC